MSMINREAAGSHLFALDNTMKHAYEGSQKRRPTYDESKVAIDFSSARTSQAKFADNESVRMKLCDSLTSALEMVVSKQLVKSVLGVVEDNEVGKFRRQGQFNLQDKVIIDGISESEAASRLHVEEVQSADKLSETNETTSMNMDLTNGFEAKGELMKDETHVRFPSLSNVNKSEVKESLVFESKSAREERGSFLEEAKGGLQLMEQAKKVARNVEANLFSLNGGVNKKYKEKARSLLFNLKDKSNPELRARVFEGEITPEILVRMSAEQLASKELSQWRSTKAEEFASMVVLTDADVDPRRIVKKTHKGEFPAVAEESGFSATTQSASTRLAIPPELKKEDIGKGGDPNSGRVGRRGTTSKVSNDPSMKEVITQSRSNLSPGSQEPVVNEVREWTVHDASRTLYPVDTLDDNVVENVEGSRNTDISVEDRTLGSLNLTPTEQSRQGKMLTKPQASLQDSKPKLIKSPLTKSFESGSSNRSSFSKRRERECQAAEWEGSIQLSTNRQAPINGFYKSGERLDLKDWPRSVEVKGRVRLEALEKFLQDLQLSRSRKVTVLSLCPSDGLGDLKQTRAYLKEMADQYQMGGRAGFVEPRPGFELYLLAPSSASLESLSLERLSNLALTSKREDEVLVGVVVWRKSQSQGLPSSSGPDQNVSNVKEVVLSSPVFESRTEFNPKPLHCTATPTSEGWLPASQNIASPSSLVNVGANSSILAIEPRGDTPTIHTPISRDWQQPSLAAIGLQVPPFVAPMHKIAVNARRAVANSVSLPHGSVDRVDVPPGFIPQPMQSFPQVRSAAPGVESKEHAQDCQGSLPYLVNGSMDVFKDTPPGFLPKPSVKALSGVERTSPDDDDLPEFNFEVEGVVSQANTKHLFPSNRTLSVVPHIHNAGLQNINDPSNRYRGHHHNIHDLHPSPTKFQPPVLDGHSLRYRSQHEESFATFVPQSASSVPGMEAWISGKRRAETALTLSPDFPMVTLPNNGTDHRNSQLRAPSQDMDAGEEEYRKFGHDSKRVMGQSENYHLRNHPYPPASCTSSLPSHSVLPPLPPVLSDHNLHSRQQVSLAHMVAQRQHSMTKNKVLNWPPRDTGSLPQQEAQHDHHWQDVGSSNPSKWQQSNSGHMHSRTPKLDRKSQQQKVSYKDEGAYENDAEPTRSGRERTRVRERSRERSVSPSTPRTPRGQKRQGNTSFASSRPKSPTKDTRSNSETSSEVREPKPVKRVRERERDQ